MKNQILKLTAMLLFSTAILNAKSQTISSEFPYESNFMALNGDSLHYIDEGEGDPILFLHGIPMSAYSWRNIIPHLSEDARCLAIDFMGFGKSDKPDIAYTYDQQYSYLERFIDSLDLKNITLVMTDIGGILGQKYARLHPEKIKGITLMETPVTNAVNFYKYGVMMQKMLFWMGGKDKFGYRMFVKKNMFIKMMSKLIVRKLSDEERDRYAEPFLTEKSRLPMFVLANGYPKKGKNAVVGDMADYLNQNSDWLVSSKLPKLILVAKPGMLINKKTLKWIDLNLLNCTTVHVGKAKHLMEEDLPLEIGVAIKSWYKALEK